MVDVKPIENDADYNAALERIDILMDAELGALDGEELDALVTLVDVYEAKCFPLDAPDPAQE